MNKNICSKKCLAKFLCWLLTPISHLSWFFYQQIHFISDRINNFNVLCEEKLDFYILFDILFLKYIMISYERESWAESFFGDVSARLPHIDARTHPRNNKKSFLKLLDISGKIKLIISVYIMWVYIIWDVAYFETENHKPPVLCIQEFLHESVINFDQKCF